MAKLTSEMKAMFEKQLAVVATATSALFRTKKTAANTFVTYRLAG